MKKYNLLESLVLFYGTIFSFTILIEDFHRFFESGGTWFSFVTKPVPHPMLIPCFYGAFAFLAAFIWSVYIYKIDEIPRALKQQKRLIYLLIGGSIFAWSNGSYLIYKYYRAGRGAFVGCSGVITTNPLATPCFKGAGLFALTLVIAIFAYRDLQGKELWTNKYKALALLGVLLFGLVLISSYLGSTKEASSTPVEMSHGSEIAPRDAYDLIQKNKGNEDFVIVDVRRHTEYSDGHIEDAINIDFFSENFEAELGKLDKSNKYLFYCRTGIRSGKALDLTKELGSLEVYTISGGLLQWEAEGLPIVK